MLVVGDASSLFPTGCADRRPGLKANQGNSGRRNDQKRVITRHLRYRAGESPRSGQSRATRPRAGLGRGQQSFRRLGGRTVTILSGIEVLDRLQDRGAVEASNFSVEAGRSITLILFQRHGQEHALPCPAGSPLGEGDRWASKGTSRASLNRRPGADPRRERVGRRNSRSGVYRRTRNGSAVRRTATSYKTGNPAATLPATSGRNMRQGGLCLARAGTRSAVGYPSGDQVGERAACFGDRAAVMRSSRSLLSGTGRDAATPVVRKAYQRRTEGRRKRPPPLRQCEARLYSSQRPSSPPRHR